MSQHPPREAYPNCLPCTRSKSAMRIELRLAAMGPWVRARNLWANVCVVCVLVCMCVVYMYMNVCVSVCLCVCMCGCVCVCVTWFDTVHGLTQYTAFLICQCACMFMQAKNTQPHAHLHTFSTAHLPRARSCSAACNCARPFCLTCSTIQVYSFQKCLQKGRNCASKTARKTSTQPDARLMSCACIVRTQAGGQ